MLSYKSKIGNHIKFIVITAIIITFSLTTWACQNVEISSEPTSTITSAPTSVSTPAPVSTPTVVDDGLNRYHPGNKDFENLVKSYTVDYKETIDIIQEQFVNRHDYQESELIRESVNGVKSAISKLVNHEATIALITYQPNYTDKNDIDDLLSDVLDILYENDYGLSSMEFELVRDFGINNMLKVLNDRYARFLNTTAYKIDQESYSGSFGGIGAYIEESNDDIPYIVISRVIKDSPAEKSGIVSGERIVAVNGISAENWSTVELVNAVRGEIGTAVSLKILTPETNSTRVVEITRAQISEPSVRIVETDNNIVHLAIASFNRNTPEQIVQELGNVVDENSKGIVIDLRFNPGGLLFATIDSLSIFLDDNEEKIALKVVDSDANEQIYRVNGRFPKKHTQLPIVIIINNFSASGSEVFSGALRDHGRGKIIGEQSFGKGSVTGINELTSGSGFYLTTSKWLTPLGNEINGVGISPDIMVETEFDDENDTYDDALELAFELILNGNTLIKP